MTERIAEIEFELSKLKIETNGLNPLNLNNNNAYLYKKLLERQSKLLFELNKLKSQDRLDRKITAQKLIDRIKNRFMKRSDEKKDDGVSFPKSLESYSNLSDTIRRRNTIPIE
jgi:hypothetical protein